MAKEIYARLDTTGLALYALLRNRAGQVWNTATPGFESYATANYANYAIPMTEDGASAYYTGSLPAVGGNVNWEACFSYKPAGSGATPAEGDPKIAGTLEGNTSSSGALQTLAAAGTSGGLPTGDGSGRVAIQVGTSAGQINGGNGKVPATLDPADVAGTPVGSVSGSPTATSFQATGSLSAVTGAYANAYLRFEAGSANAGLALPITSYNGSTSAFGFSVAWPATPIVGDAFVILGSHVP